ncbi:MAG: ATP-binding protein [Candidatus Goldbacteria bacterium]|nr:ATP-binding protein [Candidatus Goldiibacteriota bacterium]
MIRKIFKPIPGVLLYVFFGLIWIFLSDYIVMLISDSIKILTFYQFIKGTLYVIITGIGLYIVIFCYNKHIVKINKQLEKRTRILNLLSNCNQILIRNTEEDKFLNEICKLLVEYGGYKNVWIGFKENNNFKLASYYNNNYNLKSNFLDNEYLKNKIDMTIKTGKTAIFLNDKSFYKYELLFNPFLKKDSPISCFIPIKIENEVIGILNIDNIDYSLFDFDELELLEEMAKDIGYGIKERRKYKENLQLLAKIKEDNIKLKEIDKLKSNFLSIISHELRTPITPIKGFIEILLKNSQSFSENQREYLEIIKNNTLRLQKIIEDLIDISRIEKGVLQLNKEKVNIGEVISEAIRDIKFLAEQNQIIIEHQKKDLYVIIDKYRISQVIINLLNNAIKFSNKNSKIEVGYSLIKGQEIKLPEFVKYNVAYDKNYIQLNIKDYGCGIESYNLNRIFDEFYQAEDALIRKTGGLGLGLSISKSIIQLHGGEIWAESEGVAKGTTFKIILPL